MRQGVKIRHLFGKPGSCWFKADEKQSFCKIKKHGRFCRHENHVSSMFLLKQGYHRKKIYDWSILKQIRVVHHWEENIKKNDLRTAPILNDTNFSCFYTKKNHSRNLFMDESLSDSWLALYNQFGLYILVNCSLIATSILYIGSQCVADQ